LFTVELAKSEKIFAHRNLISNVLTYLLHTKSIDEFRLTLDSAMAQSKVWRHVIFQRVQTKTN